MQANYRQIPSVDKVLSDPLVTACGCPHDLLVSVARQELDAARRTIMSGGEPPPLDQVVQAVLSQVEAITTSALRPVINATGVILHTNLGRAPLSREAIAAMNTISTGYCNLEFDLETGARGSRHTYIGKLLCQLTGAEAAIVVNNNAAAVLLGLTALCKRKEVIVSRSQAVEIGGGFRIPDVMRQSGVRLVEVGTTNCTYVADYEQAVTPRTAALMRIHSSNFRIIGFTHEVSIEEMAGAAARHQLPVFDDVGSGCLIDTTQFGLAPEPTVQASIAAGAALVFFSGDKLMGGPQAGIIAGKADYIRVLAKHPLVRAMRLDKTRLAALIVTVRQYLMGEALTKIPVWQMIAAPLPVIEARARAWVDASGEAGRLVPGETMIGGGSLPGGTLPTWLLALQGGKKDANLAQRAAHMLRIGTMPVVGRVNENVLLLDPRSVLPEQDPLVIEALRGLTKSLKGPSA